METINIATSFCPRLVNRDNHQGDGKFNAVEFRDKYLKFLDNSEIWKTESPAITLDFCGVEKLGPSFANEAFAYFTQFAKPERIKRKIIFINISKIKMETIDIELTDGYSRS